MKSVGGTAGSGSGRSRLHGRFKALAHRKRLLKGVAELCAPRTDEARLHHRTRPSGGSDRRRLPSSKVHWSAVPTLREQNPDAPNPAPHAPQRLADAGGMFSFGNAEAEVLDEAAERRAFQEAVAAWRSGERAAVAAFTGEVRRFLAGRRVRRGRRAGGLPGGRGGLADARRASRSRAKQRRRPKN